ncbi:uncharacterized protein LAJ45_07466 [Morchella importuna]|uniref:3-hydroxyisobutyryl-CoA hydrolase n=1 Tax=Morchella conica CCBAS932 TaxID=1392247 RepID=A0A3N4KZC2_9PEZI|nr:uncharacterized protein LAJ45_07466 [Morchella importuna]KAH8148365.1 hypothetical protein LAJ45_07466 [Morchella importuna]RPB15910.1 ClpP/crotonase [Morchella conica CCBAS932]
MPLRSKILNPAFTKMSMSTAAPEGKALPEENPADDVLFNSVFGVRTIELNRPSKLNALNKSMAEKIVPRLQEWEKSQLANIIILKGHGGRALCAGGDVGALAALNKTGEEGIKQSIAYFGLEYQLDHLIATYTKPYVAFMDGITMGGGVGLSVHAPFRIATENTRFAMPETKIGFFPDVGASFFLPRLEGQVGTYLALTSEQLKGVQALYAGIATHYIHSSSLPDLEARLAELTFDDLATSREKWSIIDSTINEFSTGLPDEPIQLGGTTRTSIDTCFAGNTMEEIISALHAHNTPWASQTLKTLLQRSPTSLRVTLQLMRLGTGYEWTIAEAFQREYAVASHFMRHPDFVQGVEHVLLKKEGPPVWTPPKLEELGEEAVRAFVNPAPGEQRLALLRDPGVGDYERYPHEGVVGLPTEAEIRRLVVGQNTWVREDVVRYFVDARGGRDGVERKVRDVVERMTWEEHGMVRWRE